MEEVKTYYFNFELDPIRSLNANLYTYLQNRVQASTIKLFTKLRYQEAREFIEQFIEDDYHDMSYLTKYFMCSSDQSVTGAMILSKILPYLASAYTSYNNKILHHPSYLFREINRDKFQELLEVSSLTCFTNGSFDVWDSELIDYIQSSNIIKIEDFILFTTDLNTTEVSYNAND